MVEGYSGGYGSLGRAVPVRRMCVSVSSRRVAPTCDWHGEKEIRLAQHPFPLNQGEGIQDNIKRFNKLTVGGGHGVRGEG